MEQKTQTCDSHASDVLHVLVATRKRILETPNSTFEIQETTTKTKRNPGKEIAVQRSRGFLVKTWSSTFGGTEIILVYVYTWPAMGKEHGQQRARSSPCIPTQKSDNGSYVGESKLTTKIWGLLL